MDIAWSDAQTFLAVAEGGSVSAGAARLGLGQPTVSRRIALLEARWGMALFTRSQRGVELTEAGARLLPAAAQMARWASEFERLAEGAEQDASGLVRVAAPPALAVDELAPMAARLATEHPQLRLELMAAVDYVDLARGEADLALRTRAPTEPELTTLGTREAAIGVFASPAYHERLRARRAAAGRSGPVALDELDWVTWGRPHEHVDPRPMLERAIPDFRPAFASDSYLVLRQATLEGLGAMHLDALSGERLGLVEIDLGFRPSPASFHLVCAKSMRFVPRVRLVAEAIASRFDAIAGPPGA